MLADGVALGHRGDDRLAEVLRMRAREADPLDPVDRVAGAQELAELGADVGREIAAPGVDVLAEQRDLAHAVRCELRHLGDDVAGPAALLPPADRRHDAVRARRVAAHRHLHPRVRGPLAVLRQVAGEVLVRAEPAAVDARAARADPLAEVRDRARPERDVDLRVEVEDPLLLRLGEAAADGDHEVGILALPRAGIAEIGGELGVRLLADRARVEDDEIGLLLRDGLPQAERLEHALDALGVVAVHLTAERGQVVAAHGGSVGALPRLEPSVAYGRANVSAVRRNGTSEVLTMRCRVTRTGG